MANGIWYGSVNESVSGKALNNARVLVTDPDTDDLLGLFKDRDGTLPLGNPFLTREDGVIQFFVRVGRINVNVSRNGESVDFLNEIVADDWTGEPLPPTDLCDLSEFVHFTGSSTWGETTYDVAYGAGVWVSTNFGHKARKSTDGGNTWDSGVTIPGLINSYDRYTGIAYGAGNFVAVGGGSNTVAAYSIDGVSWTLATNGANLKSVVFGNGVFVAVGTDGTIKTSTDGHAWTTQASGAGGNLRKVDYADGVFMCCGYRTSPGFACIVNRSEDNGVTWTEVFTSGTWNDAISIAASDAMWAVLSDSAHGSSDNYRTSEDGGDTWTARSTAVAFSDMTSDSCWIYPIANAGALYSLENPALPALQFGFTGGGYTPFGKRTPGVGAMFWANQLNTYTHS